MVLLKATMTPWLWGWYSDPKIYSITELNMEYIFACLMKKMEFNFSIWEIKLKTQDQILEKLDIRTALTFQESKTI